MQGSLEDMSVADLIQHNCQDNKTAQVVLEHNGEQATLYFKDGSVVHAQLGTQTGEEVVYQLLGWHTGNFNLSSGQATPAQTIARSWSGLLLEGARRQDEAQQETQSNLITLFQEEKPMAKKKSEVLADALAELLTESSDIDGVAIVGVDGLVYSANVPQRALDENMVGASSAAIFGLSRRSVGQLKRGNLNQTLIQGDDGNIIVSGLNDETLLVALTPKSVNLGMAFAEMRGMIRRIQEIL
jgi:predicted regulator of Ras-like GTPase activity (Roadblock/LC7/MglB family)